MRLRGAGGAWSGGFSKKRIQRCLESTVQNLLWDEVGSERAVNLTGKA